MQTRLLPFATTALIAVLAVACSGGGDEERFDPEQADYLAAAAMPALDDFPAEDWTLIAVDEFDDEETDTTGLSEECVDYQESRDAINESLEPGRRGRAQREFERVAPSFAVPMSVEVSMEVFEDEDGLSEAFDEYAAQLSGDTFLTCFSESLALGIGQGVDLTPSPVTPLAGPPQNGVVAAGEVEYAVQGEQGTLRYELYLWHYLNSRIYVAFFGPQEAFTPQLIRTIVERVDAKLIAAAGDDPPTPVPATVDTPVTPAVPQERSPRR
jgi:hypothetical protein